MSGIERAKRISRPVALAAAGAVVLSGCGVSGLLGRPDTSSGKSAVQMPPAAGEVPRTARAQQQVEEMIGRVSEHTISAFMNGSAEPIDRTGFKYGTKVVTLQEMVGTTGLIRADFAPGTIDTQPEDGIQPSGMELESIDRVSVLEFPVEEARDRYAAGLPITHPPIGASMEGIDPTGVTGSDSPNHYTITLTNAYRSTTVPVVTPPKIVEFSPVAPNSREDGYFDVISPRELENLDKAIAVTESVLSQG
jgi:hypothetical protein